MASFTKLEQAVIAEKYRLDRIIGRGGFSAVYRGEHMAMGRPVALKVLDGSRVDAEDSKLMERFEREARVISQLEAPPRSPSSITGSRTTCSIWSWSSSTGPRSSR